MSNYIFGGLRGAEKPLSYYINSIRARTILGFHDLASREAQIINLGLPITSVGLPLPADCFFHFCLSDNPNDLTATYLLFENDWAEDTDFGLPAKHHDRMKAIEQLVRVLFEETGCCEVCLWLSESDWLEGIVSVPLSHLVDRMEADFGSRGIPCLLYQFTDT